MASYTYADGLGLMGKFVLYVFFGLLFITPGIYLVMREHQKKYGERNKGMQVLGIALISLGCIIGLGIGVRCLHVRSLNTA